MTTSEILEVIIEIIKKRDFQLNDFDIYVVEIIKEKNYERKN